MKVEQEEELDQTQHEAMDVPAVITPPPVLDSIANLGEKVSSCPGQAVLMTEFSISHVTLSTSSSASSVSKSIANSFSHTAHIDRLDAREGALC